LNNSDYFEKFNTVIRGLTHEIRNPVQGILTSAEALRYFLEENHSAGRLLDLIQRECVRINGLLTDLVALAEPLNLSKEPQSILTILQECGRMHPNLVTSVDSTLPLMRLDPTGFRRAILAVLQNAVDSQPQGGEFHMKAEANQERITIAISDRGCGIDPKDLPYVVDPFFSTRPKRAGLGLTIALKVVNQHEGDLKIESELGKGTVVTIVLFRTL